mgnify:FL=1
MLRRSDVDVVTAGDWVLGNFALVHNHTLQTEFVAIIVWYGRMRPFRTRLMFIFLCQGTPFSKSKLTVITVE